jgi:DNA transformation protein
LDQLDELHVTARRMFGSYGLYQGAVFFGIVSDDRLYFKTDDSSRHLYTERGMPPFTPNEKQKSKTYYEVPVDIVEDSEVLIEWARRAIAVNAND